MSKTLRRLRIRYDPFGVRRQLSEHRLAYILWRYLGRWFRACGALRAAAKKHLREKAVTGLSGDGFGLPGVNRRVVGISIAGDSRLGRKGEYWPISSPWWPGLILRVAGFVESDTLPAVHNLEDRIARATRLVNESRLIAEQQRKLISEGRAVPNAIQLLKEFEEALEKLEANLRGLLEERDKLAASSKEKPRR